MPVQSSRRHATKARFAHWAPVGVYARVPLLGGRFPSHYDATAAHIAMALFSAARVRFGSDRVARHFQALAGAAKKRAVTVIRERIARGRP